MFHKDENNTKILNTKTHSVKSVVDEMFEVLAHADLSHELVFVPVHAGQLTHVGKHIL